MKVTVGDQLVFKLPKNGGEIEPMGVYDATADYSNNENALLRGRVTAVNVGTNNGFTYVLVERIKPNTYKEYQA